MSQADFLDSLRCLGILALIGVVYGIWTLIDRWDR